MKQSATMRQIPVKTLIRLLTVSEPAEGTRIGCQSQSNLGKGAIHTRVKRDRSPFVDVLFFTRRIWISLDETRRKRGSRYTIILSTCGSGD